MFYGIISSNNVFIIEIGIMTMGIVIVLLSFATESNAFFRIPEVKTYRKNAGYITYSSWNMGGIY